MIPLWKNTLCLKKKRKKKLNKLLRKRESLIGFSFFLYDPIEKINLDFKYI